MSCQQRERHLSSADPNVAGRARYTHTHQATANGGDRRRRFSLGLMILACHDIGTRVVLRRMRPKLWSQFSWLCQDQRQHRKLARLRVKLQLESLGKERLHHQAHLVFCRAGNFGLRLDVEPRSCHPLGGIRLQYLYLPVGELVSKSDVIEQTDIARKESTPSLRVAIARAQGEVHFGRIVRCVRFDGGDFKRKLLTGCNLPIRHTA